MCVISSFVLAHVVLSVQVATEKFENARCRRRASECMLRMSANLVVSHGPMEPANENERALEHDYGENAQFGLLFPCTVLPNILALDVQV